MPDMDNGGLVFDEIVNNGCRVIKAVDSMLCWWEANKQHIHPNPNVVNKCGDVVRELRGRRDTLYDELVEYVWVLAEAEVACGVYGFDSDEYSDISLRCTRLGDRLSGGCVAGFYYQLRVTRLFHEAGGFTILDVEVAYGMGSFDIEVADESGKPYCVEVWFGKPRREHALDSSTARVFIKNGRPCMDPESGPDSVPARHRDVVSGGHVNLSSEPDIPKIKEKLNQLPDDRPGFLIACRAPSLLETGGTDFPVIQPRDIPANKCIIVLKFEDDTHLPTGTAFIIPPNHKHADVAKRVIHSLGFVHNQNMYDKVVRVARNHPGLTT